MINGRMETLVSVDTMRRSDAMTIAGGVPSLELMGRAAQGIFDAVAWRAPVAILAGGGNNGGDGYALACLLAAAGIQTSGAYVVSADISSGLNGDTGQADLAVQADLTVSIGFYKLGMFRGRGPEVSGRLVNVDIGIQLAQERPDG